MEILGLPLHPLIIHAVVIFVPLAALGGVAMSFFTAIRRRYGWLVVAFALVGMVSTIVAQQAGEALAATFPQKSAAMSAHIAIGDGLFLPTIILFVGTVVLMVAQRLFEADHPQGKLARWSGLVVTVVGAVVSVVQVVRIGHAGATAVWGGG